MKYKKITVQVLNLMHHLKCPKIVKYKDLNKYINMQI